MPTPDLLRDIAERGGAGADAAPAPVADVPHTWADDGTRVQAFLRAASPDEALAVWLGGRLPQRGTGSRRRLLAALDRDIAEIDRLLAEQLNAILHHPKFQMLEASWRGLLYLVGVAEAVEGAKVRVLNAGWGEICRDLDRAVEFDQSALFEKIYSEEFGTPGGEPFGLIVADYYMQHARGPGHPTDDVAALRALSQIAAAAFAPVVTGCTPVLFGLDSFRELHVALDLESVFGQPQYARWRSLQESEDARFVGIVLPRILMRRPYAHDGSRCDGFRFRETAAEVGHDGYLWGNAAYAFASVVVRAFGVSGWFAEIRGAAQDSLSGGLVVDLVVDEFATDSPGIASKFSTEVSISERQEKELADLGFIPLMRSHNTDFSVFYSNQSIQRPRHYDRAAATANARLSAMLQYVLCVSRFAHYVKVIGRDRIGAFATPEECEAYLQRWLLNYCMGNDDASPELRARYPLHEARVQVRELPGRPGAFACTVHLRPHFQLDQVVSTFRLVTELAPARAG